MTITRAPGVHDRSPSRIRAGLRWVVDHRLVLALGLAAALPVIISTVRAVLNAWTPVFDDSVIATRAFDVLSVHSPLVGEHSDSSVASVGSVFSLGPMPVWLLAFQARWLGAWSLPVTMGVINTTSIIGAVALARRRGGRALMFATAVAVALMCRSLPAEALRDVRTPEAALLPFMLLLFLAWSLACGEYRLLPVTVVVVSFVVQAHFSLVPGSVVATIVALAGLTRGLAVRRGQATGSVEDHPRPWLLGALAVALVCWSAPLLDQAIHRPGNFVRVAQTATAHQTTVGLSYGWHALVRAIGVPPWWLRYPTTGHAGGRFFELSGVPGSGAIASTVLILIALSVVLGVGLRSRRHDLAAAGALGLGLSAAVVAFTAATPQRLVLPLDYGLEWASPAGMFTWLLLGWSLTSLLVPMRWHRPTTMTESRQLAAVAVIALSITAIVGALASVNPRKDVFQWTYRPARTLTAQLVTRLPHTGSVVVMAGSIPGFVVQEGLIYQLRRAGYRVLAPPELSIRLGAYYSYRPGQVVDPLFVGDSNTPPPSAGQTIVSVPVHGAPPGAFTQQGKPPPTEMTVSILRPLTIPLPNPCPPAPRTSASGPAASRLHLVSGRLIGSIDASQVVGNQVVFCGWAASIEDRRPADSVLVFSHGSLVGAVKPTITRPDVASAIGPFGRNSGYSIQLPLGVFQLGSKKNTVQLFAVEQGVASPLAFNCQHRPQEFGC